MVVDERGQYGVILSNTLVGRGSISHPETRVLRTESNSPKIADYPEIDRKLRKVAEKYSVSYYQMKETIKGESGFSHIEVWGDDGRAYGIAQFHRGTFEGYKPESGMNYYDVDDQLSVMAYMFSIGEQSHWTEWCKRFGRQLNRCQSALKVGSL